MGRVTHVGKMVKQNVKFTLEQVKKAQRGNG
jgi:hypothetical protein